ncbi:guanine nucleotide-binding protein-like 1 [Chrysoperla carnea]|uniref:guanine nucleotide-binding protein-like 1 n=1 Tax=Chrysoperla carnea TaxID=189513 RepID=UPI001D0710D0|nr:guanine nucleotide-binding protein-like 1 [Chrysoperla carnea]XP_044731871.1 guanine nucleotide-binding protein-like 1 [Chrysoperla carnea]
MPQGRRKAPFSGKAKKEQLKAKKLAKGGDPEGRQKYLLKSRNRSDDDESDENNDGILKVNQQPSKKSNSRDRNPNRYVLQFFRETDEQLQQLKELAYQEIKPVPETELEIKTEDFYCDDLDFPKRPPWDYSMTVDQLNAKEQRYFTEYIKKIENSFSVRNIGYFELNLETWRQLWRVLEISDILLFIVDIRFAAAMFPPSLYDYVTNTLKKDMILILNKIDLVPAPVVVAWKHYLHNKYPDLRIVLFTTCPAYNLRGGAESMTDKHGLQIRRRRGKLRMATEGAQLLYDTVHEIVATRHNSKIDLSAWQQKIKEESEYDEDAECEIQNIELKQKADTSYIEYSERFKDDIVTIGCVGQPNVGKSSIMNALMGKKVVSVSKTPGHTKHFQTIYLTPNVRLCDCPGLVFPSMVPRNLQVLMGLFPIAQLRQPYYVIRYIAERVNLTSLLNIQHPENDDSWSAMDICEAWAKKRGYKTAKAARPDTYRAANSLLRMQLEGKICVCLRPVGYSADKDKWTSHPDLQKVLWIQAIDKETNDGTSSSKVVLTESESDEDDTNNLVSNIKTQKLADDTNESDSDSDVSTSPPASNQNPFAVLAE